MATQTPNLNLTKPMGTDYVRIGDFNDNADKLDATIGNPAQLETAQKTSLVLAINEAKNQGQHPPYIDDATKTWWEWNPAMHQFEDTGVPARGEKGDPGVSVTVGTTTTGLPGTSASVENVGTASDPILNFTVPRGDKGQNEINGETISDISGILVGDNGNVRAGVAGTDFAAASHAVQHAAGGSDHLTPAAIGAASAESGTFTASVKCVNQSDIAFTYTNMSCNYTKVGRLVYAYINFNIASVSGTVSSDASNFFRIDGLPFAIGGDGAIFTVSNVTPIIGKIGAMGGSLGGGSATGILFLDASTGAKMLASAAAIAVGKKYIVTAVYRTAT